MTFEIDFPSLKGKVAHQYLDDGTPWEAVDLEDLQANCLDKQIVERDYVKKDKTFPTITITTVGQKVYNAEPNFIDKEKIRDAIERVNWSNFKDGKIVESMSDEIKERLYKELGL